ncbi:hypothetical protein SKAU_G00424230 [Synaphobranchus kaupii]|uniref:Uncharacterized protein n=1 Tax=Synaphobranchus kaupii TaxID=118154 RepID=A0A9Q1E5J8_SYNKA|nr:hypothetical protein SKAU_G00424230 [Synaphobranchus kaupii]
MDRCNQRLHEDCHNQLKKLITTAYHVAKTEQPFTQYPALLDLQAINGVDVGGKYKSKQACQRVKTELLDTVQESLRKRFKDVETPCESSR